MILLLKYNSRYKHNMKPVTDKGVDIGRNISIDVKIHTM